MSTGERLSHEVAAALAHDLRQILAPACERIMVAGSIRRGLPTVGDLELVALPRMRPAQQVGLFGGGGRPVSRLWDLVEDLVNDPESDLQRHPDIEVSSGGTRAAPWGDRYRKLLWRGAPVDLFTADADSWGAILLIRTGPPEYSQAWVTELRGAGLAMRGGFVRSLDTDEIVPCPDEATALRMVGWRVGPMTDRQAWQGTEPWSHKPSIEGR